MPRYFLHLRHGTSELLDVEGRELPGLSAVRDAVLFTAREVMARDLRNGCVDLRLRVDAEDETGILVHTMPFEHAINIIVETSEAPVSVASCTR